MKSPIRQALPILVTSWLFAIACDPGKDAPCLGDPSTGDSDGDGLCDSDDPCPFDLVWDGNYTITDAASLSALKDYGVIKGSLILDPSFPNLVGPACLRRIDGDLVLQDNATLQTLSGLDSLEEVGGNVAIVRNDALVSVDLGGPLISIGGGFYMDDNFYCADVTLPASLETIGGDFWFRLSAVTALTIPAALRFVGGSFYFDFNMGPTELQLPDSLEEIGKSLIVVSCNSLQTIHLPAGLTRIGGDCLISGNDNLLALSIPVSLAKVDGNLYFEGNNVAADLSAPGLESVSGVMRITADPALPTCRATELRDQLSELGGACIRDNAADTCDDDLSGC
jgi:hypothetical protein